YAAALAATRDPRHRARALRGLAAAAETAGDLPAARARLTDAAATAPDVEERALALLELARVHRKLGAAALAGKSARDAGKLTGDPAVRGAAAAELAGLRLAAGDGAEAGSWLAKAEEAWREAVRSGHSRQPLGEVWLNLAGLLRGRGQLEESRQALDAATLAAEDAGVVSRARQGLGLLAETEGRLEEAEQRYQEALGGEPPRGESAAAWLSLADLLRKTGRDADAKKACVRATEQAVDADTRARAL